MILLATSLALGGDLLIEGGAVWQGGSGPPVRADVWVHDGTIEAVGLDLAAPADALRIDATGATVLPGLIDAHVHLSMDPGAAWRSIDADEHAALLRQHLGSLLACGVTTVLDPAILPDELALIRSTLDAGAPGPRYLTLGTPLSPRDGYVAAVIDGFPGVSTPAEVEAALDLVASQGAIGVKTTVEPGMLAEIWPLYPPELRAAIREGAAARSLPVFAHAMTPETYRIALEELGARVMVHPPDRPDADTIAAAAAAGVSVMSTLMPTLAFNTWDDLWLDDPWLTPRVPAAELAAARDPSVIAAFQHAALTTLMPRLPAKRLFGRSLAARQMARAKVRHIGEALRALADAGVPIVLGSDSGNWPIIPTLFHGPSTLLEMEALARAGFSPVEVLQAATTHAAAALGLQGQVGAVAAGQAADLLIVPGDPTTDLGALREPRVVVRAGEARRPDAWLSAPWQAAPSQAAP